MSDTPKAEPSPLPMDAQEIARAAAEYDATHVAPVSGKLMGWAVRWGARLLATIASRDAEIKEQAAALAAIRSGEVASGVMDVLNQNLDAHRQIETLRSDLASMTLEARNLAQHLKERTEEWAGEIEARKKAEAERDKAHGDIAGLFSALERALTESATKDEQIASLKALIRRVGEELRLEARNATRAPEAMRLSALARECEEMGK